MRCVEYMGVVDDPGVVESCPVVGSCQESRFHSPKRDPSLFVPIYHINRPTPSRGKYRNTPIVTPSIAAYHTPSRTRDHVGTSATCDLNKMYGTRK